MAKRSAKCTVVVPAHNEEATLGRLLQGLFNDPVMPMDVIIVPNGCTDSTADIARSWEPRVRVLELETGSKVGALRAAVPLIRDFPVVYVDADVQIDAFSVAQLVDHLHGTTLATAPARKLDFRRASALVKAYYDIWQDLPQVRAGLFGRGVIALSKQGQDRIGAQQDQMSDDLLYSETFLAKERLVCSSAVVTITVPRTLRDLVARRTRVIVGNASYDTTGANSRERTSPRSLLAICRERPSAVFHMPVFLGVTLLARRRARRRLQTGDYSTWDRDESSRSQ